MATAQSQSAGANGEGNHFNDVDSTTILNEKSLKAVMDEISILKAMYFQLGRELEVPAHELDTLRIQYGAVNINQAFNDMVLLWLRGRSTRTWQALVKAVDKFNHDLAKEIAGHHRAGSSQKNDQKEEVVDIPSQWCGTPDRAGDILDGGSEDAGVLRGWAKTEHIWSGRTILKVKFLNAVPPKWAHGWNTRNIIDLANKWRGKVAEAYGKASECVPKFVENKELGDIRVRFITDEDRENGETTRSEVGTLAETVTDQDKPTMWLYLGGGGSNYQTHLVVHEFGHALGLLHEHQRSDFWDRIEKYLKEDTCATMKKDADYKCDVTDIDSPMVIKEKYDPQSVMHYPLNKSLFIYESEEAIVQAGLPPEDRDILLGVFRINHHKLPTEPSEDDAKCIMKMYKKPETPPTTEPSPGQGPPPPRKNREDEKPTLRELQCLKGNGKEVRVIDSIAFEHWENVAIALKIPRATIQRIKGRCKDDHFKACREMLESWLGEVRGCRTPISWKTLLSAIEEGTDEEGLAREVRECF